MTVLSNVLDRPCVAVGRRRDQTIHAVGKDSPEQHSPWLVPVSGSSWLAGKQGSPQFVVNSIVIMDDSPLL